MHSTSRRSRLVYINRGDVRICEKVFEHSSDDGLDCVSAQGAVSGYRQVIQSDTDKRPPKALHPSFKKCQILGSLTANGPLAKATPYFLSCPSYSLFNCIPTVFVFERHP